MTNYPVIKFVLIFISGVLLAPLIQISELVLLIIVCSLFIILLVLIYAIKGKLIPFKSLIAYLLILLSSVFITKLRMNEFNSPLVKFYKERNSEVYGTVQSVELKRDFEVVFIIESDTVIVGGNKYFHTDKLLCKFRGDSLQREQFYNSVMPGNSVYLSGVFVKGREQRNPGEFDYNRYLNSIGIPGILICNEGDSINIVDNNKFFFSSLIFSARKFIDSRIHTLFQPETAGLLRGLLLADRSEIDFELKTQFINSGVIHVLAVSGLHVGYILIIFVFLFGRFNVYLRAIFISIGLLSFMFITGVPPSVFRATVMALIILFAFIFNRSTNLINSISIAAIFILIIDPLEIYNPGFQLSFSAVLAIGIIFPVLENEIKRVNIRQGFLRGVLLFMGVSLSAQIGTMPFTLAYFGKLSVAALFANLLVIPAIGVVIALAFTTLFISIISVELAAYFAVFNDLVVSFLFTVVSFSGSLDYSFIRISQYSLFDAFIFYLLISFVIYILKTSKNFIPKLVVSLLVVFNIIYISSVDDVDLMPDNRLSIMMIDVGQGDAILIKFPDNQTALIDAGDLNPFFDNGERVLIPLLDYLGIRKVDYGFISHLDADHYGGFVSLLYKGMISEIFKPLPDSSDKDLRLEAYLDRLNVNVNYYTKEFYEFGGAKLYILNDDTDSFYNTLSGNDKSGMMKLVYGDVSFLFTGDIEKKAEQYYVESYSDFLNVDVLKVAHHGSKTSSTDEFLSAASPQLSLISAGIKNKFRHPADEVIERLEYFGSDIVRTDVSGALLFYCDGKNIEFINWKDL